MAVLDGLFQKYRNSNKNRSVVQGNTQQQQTHRSEFGQEAVEKNPNLEIFNNA